MKKSSQKILLDTAKEAGKIIMGYYENGAKVQIKEDKSPVTEADIAANDCIIKVLAEIEPSIQIVSEESRNATPSSLFWLVDPLDGTKSFINRTGEFTVNIGLVENGIPVWGVVYLPVKKVLYYTDEQYAYREDASGTTIIEVRKPDAEGMVVVASKSHRTPETDEYISKLKVKEFVSASSSLKFCLIAEGKADLYPRFGATMEWDTAAAHAVLLKAGGTMTNIDGTPFTYGKSEYRNPYFIASGAK